MHEELRSRVLGAWAALVSRRPVTVLVVASLAAAASLAVTARQLRFESDRNRLIADDLDWNERFNDWRTSFVGKDDLTIVVDTSVGGKQSAKQRAKAEAVVTALAEALEKDHDHVEQVVAKFDVQSVGPKALRMQNWEQFDAEVSRVEQAQPLLENPRPVDLLASIESMFGDPPVVADDSDPAQSIRSLSQMLENFRRVLAADAKDRPLLASLMESTYQRGPRWRFLESPPDGRLLFIRVTPRIDRARMNAFFNAIEAIRATMRRVGESHPDVEFGLTGLEVVEADETAAATRDSMVASIVAFLLIAVLLIMAFHSWRTPLLALVSLVYGIIWTFGYLTLVIGYLQVISVLFCVILLGLGIAYGIHLASRFELVRHRYPDGPDGFEAAMRDSLATMGPGIITGAVTTAAAFVTTVFTKFKGVGEMGLIASGGIVLCLLAMFSVFPALLRLVKPRHKDTRAMDRRWFHFFEERWVMPFVRWPRVTVWVAFAMTVVSLLAITRMRFDYNLMALQPRGVDSVEWQQRIARFGGRSIFAAVCIVDDAATAERLTVALRELETVQEVGGAGLLFPEADDKKVHRLRQARDRLGSSLDLIHDEADAAPPTSADAMLERLMSLRLAVEQRKPLVTVFVPGLRGPFQDLSVAVEKLIGVHRSLEPQALATAVARLDDEYMAWRRQTARQIDAVLDTSTLKFEDLPADLMQPYRDDRGRLALEIYPDNERFDFESPLDPKFMTKFVHDMRGVIAKSAESAAAAPAPRPQAASPRGGAAGGDTERYVESVTTTAGTLPVLTGPMLQFFESGQLILDSYRIAGVSALVVVFLLVLIDFQRVGDAVLAVVPVGVGFAMTFGAMWVLGVSLNPANIMVLPLMFGIGVDSGVHVLHRHRQDRHNQPLGLTAGTGKGITITSLTTMIGFGALMLARHRGIFSLGLVMTMGIGLTMIVCLTLMPAWLELRRRGRQARNGDASGPDVDGGPEQRHAAPPFKRRASVPKVGAGIHAMADPRVR
jgi:predicted RND superfamily exporter protein